jgi:hypothetical protein
MTKDEALDLALDALESVLANHNGAPVMPWIEARDAIKQARALDLDKKAENTMIYRTFEQWKSGNVLEHGVPRIEHYSEDQLDLVEMGWNYGYDAGRAVEQALDKKAENARELGLDYEPHKGMSEHIAQATNGRVCIDPVAGDVGIGTLPAAPVLEGRDWSLLEATQESLREHMAEIKRLKAAQPAVPDAIIEAGESPEFRDGWNQCRETMLQMLKARNT